MRPVFLVLNAGSSSIKFQLFDAGGTGEPRRIYRGLFEGLGSSPHFVVRDEAGAAVGEARWGETERFGHEEALAHLGTWIGEHGATTTSRPLATGSCTGG